MAPVTYITMQSITPKTRKALEILRDNPGLTANRFAAKYFTDPEHEYLFTAVSNQGEGACSGKKAWLSAGSLLGRLRKQGLVAQGHLTNPPRWFITASGMAALRTPESDS